MPYESRKVHLDLITDQGEVCVLHLTWIRFRERWHGQAYLEHHDRGGRRCVLRCVGIPPMMDFERGIEHLPSALELPDGELGIQVKPVHEGWDPVVPSPCPHLQWSIAALRSRVHLEWPTAQGPRRMSGEGTIALTRITAPPRKLRLRSLRWGRAHQFERSLAFMALELEDDKRWFVGVTRLHGRPARSYGNLQLGLDQAGGEGTVRFGTGGQVLRLKTPRLLYAGPALDAERVPAFLHRQACQWAGGPQEERRWLAKTRVDGAHGEGLALHEHVLFGKHARKAARSRPS